MEKGSIAGTQIGGLLAVVGGLTLNQWLAIGGFLLALASFIFQAWISWYFKQKHYRLAELRLRNEIPDLDLREPGEE